ncbi:MAG: flagellar basal body L-ring protein FlgH [Pseudomonadales bacterium]
MNVVLDLLRPLAVLLLVLVIGGCAALQPARPGNDPRFSATMPEPAPVPTPAPAVADGTIYNVGTSVSLFQDFKARRVGDVLSVVLAERTNARKSANASASKEASVSIPDPVVFGRTASANGIPIFNADGTASRDFEGQGDAAQSNLLEGTITVTVAEVLGNGNLVVQGEKWMKLNQGEEYLRLRGIVRPVDIRADNTVLSTQIGDARIAYGGTGTLAQSNSPGWLSRFFNSPLWPF